MKFRLFFALALLMGMAQPSQAFLSSSDPDNFFTLLESAPVVAVVELASLEAPASGRPFFLYQLKKSALLRGDSTEDRLKVADEVLVPGQKPLFPSEGESLVFLTPIPDFTAYRELRSRGFHWRVYGGKRGVWPAESTLTLAKNYLAASSTDRSAILLQTLKNASPQLRRDAVLMLAKRPAIPLSIEEASLLGDLAVSGVAVETALASVEVLAKADNDAARQALIKLSDGPSSSAKWAAIRALEKKGQARSVTELSEDYQAADAAGRSQALSLIAAKKDADALAFFNSLLAGPIGFEYKREVIQKMAEQRNSGYEKLLIKNMGGADEAIQAEAILALGKMGSAEAVPLVLPLLDSPSSKLRGAAFFMLIDSPDPRAQAVISQRYERDHHGGWEKNPHFYGNPQPER